MFTDMFYHFKSLQFKKHSFIHQTQNNIKIKLFKSETSLEGQSEWSTRESHPWGGTQ